MSQRTTGETAWYTHTSSTHTMRTWTRTLQSFEDVPPEFHAAFPEYRQQFPYTLLIPEDRFSLFHKRNEKLLCLCDEALILLEAGKRQIKMNVFPFHDVIYVELGRVLLHSWLRIHGLSGTATVTFNTVNIEKFEYVTERLYREIHQLPSGDTHRSDQYTHEQAKFDYLIPLKYKFMSYGRHSIHPGDTVIATAYQPDRLIEQFSFFRKPLYTTYATGHLSILTDKELIIIKESQRTKHALKELYGAVVISIPLRCLRKLAMIPDAAGTHRTLEYSLADETCLSLDVSNNNPMIETFPDNVNKAIALSHHAA